ncbi:uncharacterized protein RJT20DRAFT_127898 [Scheffersomyces xylosifermentans]|uniref:uncharacterized protein n=1 Tax=Scheffersomyces xylosifermentans TaxID=1304137 RepID=UPI00315DFFCF
MSVREHSTNEPSVVGGSGQVRDVPPQFRKVHHSKDTSNNKPFKGMEDTEIDPKAPAPSPAISYNSKHAKSVDSHLSVAQSSSRDSSGGSSNNSNDSNNSNNGNNNGNINNISINATTTTPQNTVHHLNAINNNNSSSSINNTTNTPNNSNNNIFMRRNKQVTDRRSSVPYDSNTANSPSPSHTLLSSQMALNRSLVTLQAQQRNPNSNAGPGLKQLSTPRKFMGPLTSIVPSHTNTPNNGSVLANGFEVASKPLVTTTSESDKKRLVDQFYNSVNESAPVSRSTSATELESFFKANAKKAHSPTAEKALKWMETPSHEPEAKGIKPLKSKSPINFTDEKFNNIINSGGFSFPTNSLKLIEDEELTNYLLNIDTIIEDISKDNEALFAKGKIGPDGRHHPHVPNKESLEPLSRIMRSLSSTLAEKSKLILLEEGDSQMETLEQLNALSRYLSGLSRSTNELREQLVSNREEIKSKYQSNITDSLNRLRDLSDELNNLENKLTKIKHKVNESKSIMSREMADKIDVLEYINDRFKEHSTEKRNLRFKQLNIGLAVLVVVVSVYFTYR